MHAVLQKQQIYCYSNNRCISNDLHYHVNVTFYSRSVLFNKKESYWCTIMQQQQNNNTDNVCLMPSPANSKGTSLQVHRCEKTNIIIVGLLQSHYHFLHFLHFLWPETTPPAHAQ